MKQTGLIQRVIEAVGLDDGMSRRKVKPAPSEAKPLVKDENGEPMSRMFSYSSVLGIILYLSEHTCPYVVSAVNRCA